MTNQDFAEMRQRWQTVFQAMMEDVRALNSDGWHTSADVLKRAAKSLRDFDDFAAAFPSQDEEQKKC